MAEPNKRLDHKVTLEVAEAAGAPERVEEAWGGRLAAPAGRAMRPCPV